MQTVEVCPSGLRSTLGKRVSGQPFRRFESSRFRQLSINTSRMQIRLVFILSYIDSERTRTDAISKVRSAGVAVVKKGACSLFRRYDCGQGIAPAIPILSLPPEKS